MRQGARRRLLLARLQLQARRSQRCVHAVPHFMGFGLQRNEGGQQPGRPLRQGGAAGPEKQRLLVSVWHAVTCGML